MPDVLIVNASPLIFLGNADRLERLHAMGAERFVVPKPVFDEDISGGHTDRAAQAVSQAAWLEKQASPPPPDSVVAWDLGLGESSVVALALQERGSRVVIDDLNGRKCALAHGLRVVGTLGVAIAAYRRGQIEDPQAVLLELRAAGMWLSDAVIDRVLRAAGIEP